MERVLLSGPAPPHSADASVPPLTASRRRQAQVLVGNVDVNAGVLLCTRTGDFILPTPGSCAMILQFTVYNYPKSEKALQMFVEGLACEHGIIFPSFHAVYAFFKN